MATEEAEEMAGFYGMGKYLYSYSDLYTRNESTDAMNEEIDRILHEQYDRAVKLLQDNRDKLDLLANELLQKKSLTGVESEHLLNNKYEDINIYE